MRYKVFKTGLYNLRGNVQELVAGFQTLAYALMFVENSPLTSGNQWSIVDSLAGEIIYG